MDDSSYYKGKFHYNINGKLYNEKMKVFKIKNSKEKEVEIKTNINKYNDNLSTNSLYRII